MLRRQRKRVPIPSDTSDDDSPPPGKRLRSTSLRQNNLMPCLQTALIPILPEQPDYSGSVNSLVVKPTKRCNKQPVRSTIVDLSSSDSEGIIQPGRHGPVNPLSDYDTGNSTDKASCSSSSRGQRRDTVRGLLHTDQRNNLSESSRNDSVIQTRSDKRWKRKLPVSRPTDSSDSGLPLGFTIINISSSSDESVFDESTNGLLGYTNNVLTKYTRSSGTTDNSSRPTTSRVTDNTPGRQASTQARSGSPLQEVSDSSLIPLALNKHGENHLTSSNRAGDIRIRPSRHEIIPISSSDSTSNSDDDERFPIRFSTPVRQANILAISESPLQETSDNNRFIPFALFEGVNYLLGNLNSNGNIRYSPSRHHIIPISSSDNSSNSDEDERFPVEGSVRPGARRTIHESNEDTTSSSDNSSNSDEDERLPVEGPVRHGARRTIRDSNDDTNLPNSIGIVNTHEEFTEREPSSTNKILLGSSSDSDGESEKCPICLDRFYLQEIGIPTSCEHRFCLRCIQKWAKNSNTCPVDRRTFRSVLVHANIEGKVVREIKFKTPSATIERYRSERFLEEGIAWLRTLPNSVLFGNEPATPYLSTPY